MSPLAWMVLQNALLVGAVFATYWLVESWWAVLWLVLWSEPVERECDCEEEEEEEQRIITPEARG